MQKTFGWHLFLAGVLLLGAGDVRAQSGGLCFMDVPADACFSSGDPVAACEQKLETAPSLAVRLSLCQALLAADELSRAAVVIDGATASCGANRTLCRNLLVAQSNVEELLHRATRENPEDAISNERVLRTYCMGRLANRGSIDACAQLLLGHPDDMEVLTTLGRKLLQTGEPTEALRRYRRAEAELGSSAELTALIDEALVQRQVLVDGCVEDGDLADCASALLSGEADEFDLRRQLGRLLAADRRYADASLELGGALELTADRGLAREILSLLPEATRAPIARRTRGQAYLILGDGTAALGEFRTVLRVDPNDDEAHLGLDEALALRRGQIERACVTDADPAACESLLIPGEADAARIEGLLATLRAPVTGPGEADAAQSDPVVADLNTEAVNPKTDPIEPDDVIDDAPDEAADDLVARALPVITNAIRPDGRTH